MYDFWTPKFSFLKQDRLIFCFLSKKINKTQIRTGLLLTKYHACFAGHQVNPIWKYRNFKQVKISLLSFGMTHPVREAGATGSADPVQLPIFTWPCDFYPLVLAIPLMDERSQEMRDINTRQQNSFLQQDM